MSTTSDVRVPLTARWIAVLLHTALVVSLSMMLATRYDYRGDSTTVSVVAIVLLIIDFPVSLVVILPVLFGMAWFAQNYYPDFRGPLPVGIIWGVIGALYQYWLVGVLGRYFLRRRQRSGTFGRGLHVAAAVAALVVLAAAIVPWALRTSIRDYPAPAVAFAGDSRDLKRSVIVPTLDTPLPEGKNVLWCATFQMAWDHLKDDVVGEPILLRGAQDVADRLNQSAYPPSGIEENDYYATAGWTKDGIVEQIRKQMRKRFDREPMELGDAETAAIAYAYLHARVPFTIPYLKHRGTLSFLDNRGKETAVTAFGLADSESSGMPMLWEQFKVLYASSDAPDKRATEYAVDLCRHSKPYQIVLARVSPRDTLQDTLAHIQQAIDAEPTNNKWKYNVIGLTVPDMNWSVDHHFRELTGRDKLLLNRAVRGHYIDEAMQTIEFRLDRSGAQVRSEAKLETKTDAKMTAPLDLRFDRPFLLYITRRGGARPFFVMWVDNAELLSKREVP